MDFEWRQRDRVKVTVVNYKPRQLFKEFRAYKVTLEERAKVGMVLQSNAYLKPATIKTI